MTTAGQDSQPHGRFISLRWRLVLPFAAVMILAMIGVYAAFGSVRAEAAANPFAAEALAQLTGLLMATVTAAVVIVAFVAASWVADRADRVRRVAESLAAGDMAARTNMRPTDEIGAMGRALDLYAERVQERQDALRISLRRQRREYMHLTSILEALPDGVVVQDMDGRVTFMNDGARAMVGGGLNGANLEELTAAVTDALGPALAPGLYTLGDPRRVALNDKVLSIQAIAITSLVEQRLGTVLLLRDITKEVRLERAQEAMLERISDEIDQVAHNANNTAALQTFAREVTRHAVALQKVILEMRDLNAGTEARTAAAQRALPLETLIYAVANEWKQAAQSANIDLRAVVEKTGLYILGDERRLRWAIGNIIDNAIKYTPPGGTVTLEIKGEGEGAARLRVRDTGVGIRPDELPHVFTRFYRGTPITPQGRALRVPGTGQGLSIAKHIIESHGGKIYVKSTLGVGTAVYFTLPLTAAEGLPLVHDDMNTSKTIRLEQESGD